MPIGEGENNNRPSPPSFAAAVLGGPRPGGGGAPPAGRTGEALADEPIQNSTELSISCPSKSDQTSPIVSSPTRVTTPSTALLTASLRTIFTARDQPMISDAFVAFASRRCSAMRFAKKQKGR